MTFITLILLVLISLGKSQKLNGAYLSQNDNNVLTTKSYYSIDEESKNLTLIKEYEIDYNATHKYEILTSSTFLKCVNTGFFRCLIINAETNETIKSIFYLQDTFNIQTIPYSLSILKLEEKKMIFTLWYDYYHLKGQMIDYRGIRLSYHFSLNVVNVNDKDPFISVDSFPKENKILIGYSQNLTNYISIYSIEHNRIIKHFVGLIYARNSILIKVLSEYSFVVCVKKGNPRNTCKIIHFNSRYEVKKTIPFETPTSIMKIFSLSNRILLGCWKKSSKELRWQLIDIVEGEKLGDERSVQVPIDDINAKIKIIKADIFRINNEVFISSSVSGDFEATYLDNFSIDLMCEDIYIPYNTVFTFSKVIKGKFFEENEEKIRIFFENNRTALGNFFLNDTNEEISGNKFYQLFNNYVYKGKEDDFILYKAGDESNNINTEYCRIYIIPKENNLDNLSYITEKIDEFGEVDESEQLNKNSFISVSKVFIIYFTMMIFIWSYSIIYDLANQQSVGLSENKGFSCSKRYLKEFSKNDIYLSKSMIPFIFIFIIKRYYFPTTKISYHPKFLIQQISMSLMLKIYISFIIITSQSLFKGVFKYLILYAIINLFNSRDDEVEIYYDAFQFKEIIYSSKITSKPKEGDYVRKEKDYGNESKNLISLNFSYSFITFMIGIMLIISFFSVYSNLLKTRTDINDILTFYTMITFYLLVLIFFDLFLVLICIILFAYGFSNVNFIVLFPPFITYDLSSLESYTDWLFSM